MTNMADAQTWRVQEHMIFFV